MCERLPDIAPPPHGPILSARETEYDQTSNKSCTYTLQHVLRFLFYDGAVTVFELSRKVGNKP